MSNAAAFRAAASPLFHHIQLPPRSIPGRGQFSKLSSHPNGVRLFARYTQAADNLFSSRLQDRVESLPGLLEDIVQTSISTGPRGALRLAQGVQAIIGVGSEWLADVSKV